MALDQFTGKVIQLSDELKPSRAEAIMNQFGPVHFGTFGGRLTQILYVFVGLASTILMVTGVVMWWYRRKLKENLRSPLRSLNRLSVALMKGETVN